MFKIHVSSGVPQGSVLEPLLFVIYIDGPAKLVKECTFADESSGLYLYADDAKLFSSCLSDLQNALDLVHKWTKN